MKENKKIEVLKEKSFSLEKELQTLTEENLRDIFGIDFITTEFELQGLRIDTLAFDSEANSFVIIEYKRDQSFSIIDQGFSYLSLLLNNRAEFVLEYNRLKKVSFSKDDIDWTQARVIFVARSFTVHQQGAVNFKDLPIELWEIARYGKDLVLYNQVKSSDANSSIKDLGTSSAGILNVSKEVRSYTEDGYIASRPGKKGKDIYQKLKEKILLINPDFDLHPTKTYISFRLFNNWRNIFSCIVYGDKVRIEFMRSEPRDFKDPENKVTYRKDSMKYFNQHVSFIEVNTFDEIDYAVFLAQQAYARFLKN